jgi:hypothetical protein
MNSLGRFRVRTRGRASTLLSTAALVLLLAPAFVAAQAPGGGLSPLSPPANAPVPLPPPPAPTNPYLTPGQAGAPAAPQGAAPAPAPAAPPAVPRAQLDPVLFVAEGLDPVVPLAQLRARLAEALGRELVSLVDARAHDARSTVWMGLGPYHVVLRVSPPQRSDVWRQIGRTELGADPAGTLVKAVLEMFWADSFARLDAAELQDPFCPPGLICLDARRSYGWPPPPEPEVLDPWDTSYRRFYGHDPFAYPLRHPGSAALTPPHPGRTVRADLEASPYYRPHAGELSPPGGDAEHPYALSFFSGGGVHKGGAFFRYEFNAVRRFRIFDFGLAFIGARGQPEPPTKARRAITALLARRFTAEDFELDLGASFGTFFATFEAHGVEVRPYLRAMVTFALPLGRLFDLLVRSDLATTFAPVQETGAVEYSLSLGLRHRM